MINCYVEKNVRECRWICDTENVHEMYRSKIPKNLRVKLISLYLSIFISRRCGDFSCLSFFFHAVFYVLRENVYVLPSSESSSLIETLTQSERILSDFGRGRSIFAIAVRV